jgi:hypothetical protein
MEYQPSDVTCVVQIRSKSNRTDMPSQPLDPRSKTDNTCKDLISIGQFASYDEGLMKRRVLSWFNHDCPQGDQRPVELLLRPAKSAVVPRRRMDISCPGALPSRRRVLHIHENMANKIKGILPRIVAQVTPATARSGTAGEWELQRGILEVLPTPKLEDASHKYNTSCRHPPTILYEQGGDPHTYTRRRMSLSPFSLWSMLARCGHGLITRCRGRMCPGYVYPQGNLVDRRKKPGAIWLLGEDPGGYDLYGWVRCHREESPGAEVHLPARGLPSVSPCRETGQWSCDPVVGARTGCGNVRVETDTRGPQLAWPRRVLARWWFWAAGAGYLGREREFDPGRREFCFLLFFLSPVF